MSFCSSCGTALSDGSAFCRSCGQSASGGADSGRSSEHTFFQGPDVLVTNTRLVRGNETFAMSGVTSVSSFTEVPSKKGPIILIAVGVLAVLSFKSSAAVGLIGIILLALGIWWFRSIKNLFHVRLVTASGERDALSSRDGQYVGEIVGAVSQAIVHRG